MLRDIAVARIKQGLGFRTGTGIDAAIVSALQEAQRDLEKGKTLPKFLLLEDQALTLLAAAHSVNIPNGFIREFDTDPLRYLPTGTTQYTTLPRKTYAEALAGNFDSSITSGPKIYVLRKSTIDFINTADRNYSLLWTYYAAEPILSTNIENGWLKEGPPGPASHYQPEWLIGAAGIIIADDLRDQVAVAKFEKMATKGRAAMFTEILADDEAGGAFALGSNF